MCKKNKYSNVIGDLFMGLIFITISVVLYFGRDTLYKYVVNIVVSILLLLSIFQFIKYFFKKQSVKESRKTFLSCLFNLFVCLVFVMLPNLPLGILPVIFSIYLFLLGSSQFIMYLLLLSNKDKDRIRNLFWGIVYYSISIPILFSPINKISDFLLWLSLYTFLLGITFIYDFFVAFISKKTKDQFKRKIRITLPVIFEAIIPYSVMIKINKTLETSNDYKHYESREDSASDMYILIHTSSNGVNKFGHIDVYFDGQVISYGNYDEGSRKYKQMFGDGVLFMTDCKEEYIDFCIDNSKKTLFEFGIKLNDKQKCKVRQRINDILSNTVIWNYKDDKKYNNGNSYVSKLYKRTKARFYKFKSGKYKTYFVLGTNCCYLADDIIGKSGSDILSLNGIITPGTYYDYLNKELHRKNSIVISRKIYNANRRSLGGK